MRCSLRPAAMSRDSPRGVNSVPTTRCGRGVRVESLEVASEVAVLVVTPSAPLPRAGGAWLRATCIGRAHLCCCPGATGAHYLSWIACLSWARGRRNVPALGRAGRRVEQRQLPLGDKVARTAKLGIELQQTDVRTPVALSNAGLHRTALHLERLRARGRARARERVRVGAPARSVRTG